MVNGESEGLPLEHHKELPELLWEKIMQVWKMQQCALTRYCKQKSPTGDTVKQTMNDGEWTTQLEIA